MEQRFRELEEAILDLKLEIQKLISTLLQEQARHKDLLETLVKMVEAHNVILRGDATAVGIQIKVDRLEQEAHRRDRREVWVFGTIGTLILEAIANWIMKLKGVS